MRYKHFKSIKQISQNDKIMLMVLVEDCNMIYKKSLESLIDEIDEKSVFCVYDSYGQICGFATAADNDTYIDLAELYVHPSSRRKGCGHALIELVRLYAKQKGYDFITLSVGVENKNAQKIYSNNKFLFNAYNNSSTIHMKRYVSNNAYSYGAILYELSKTFGEDNLSKDVILVKDAKMYNWFEKYFKNKNETLEKHLNSPVLFCAAEVIEILNYSHKPKTRTNVNNILKKHFPKLSEKQAKSVSLSCQAFFDFQLNEKYGSMLNEKNLKK